MDMCLSLCAAIASGLAALLAVWSWLWATRMRTNVPGPPTVPLLGNALYFRKLPVLTSHLRALHRQCGDVFRIYVATKLLLVVTRAEDVRKVLTASKGRDPYCTEPIRCFVGDGLITSYGNKWKTHRRAIESAFSREVVEKFIDTFNDAADFVCERLAMSAGSEQNVYSVIFQATLQSIAITSFGVSLDDVLLDSKQRDELAEMLMTALNFVQKKVFLPWMRVEWVVSLTADGRMFRRVIDIFHSLITSGLDEIFSKPISQEHNRKMNLRDILLRQNERKNFSTVDIYDEVSTLVLTGSDTTAGTMSYALSLLALHPEWQDRAYRELDDVYGNEGDYLRPSTMEDMNNLLVIESIIKETMRLFPVASVVPHQVSEDVPLGGGRYVAPRDTGIFVAYFLLHRHPDVFPDPDKFDPSRFLDGESAARRPPFSYLPFGGGPHRCVGERYAMIQMKTYLSGILRRFRFLPGSTQDELEQVIISVTGHPVTGYKVTCMPRDNTLAK